MFVDAHAGVERVYMDIRPDQRRVHAIEEEEEVNEI